MSKLNPKILIISYTFPPAPGIGGRRWAKFSKYLDRSGYDVKVITNKSDKNNSKWIKDIDNTQIKVKRVASAYPGILDQYPTSIFQKIKYRLSLAYLKTVVKGNYYDRSIFWRKRLLSEVEKSINEGYENVIVSVAPFRTAYFISELKLKYPYVNFIVDFRDPWVNNRTAFGFKSLSEKRLRYESKLEKQVVETFDQVISVSDKMNEHFIQYDVSGDKFTALPNGFDDDDIRSCGEPDKNDRQLNIIFAGSVYDESETLIQSLSTALNTLKKENAPVYSDLKFNFYGTIPQYFNELIDSHRENIFYHGKVSIDEVTQKIANSDACLLILTEDINYSLSTKFCEYVAAKKPVLVLTFGGWTGDFVENNRIGFSLTPENMVDQLMDIHSKWKSNQLTFNKDFDVKQYDIKFLTEKLTKLLK